MRSRWRTANEKTCNVCTSGCVRRICWLQWESRPRLPPFQWALGSRVYEKILYSRNICPDGRFFFLLLLLCVCCTACLVPGYTGPDRSRHCEGSNVGLISGRSMDERFLREGLRENCPLRPTLLTQSWGINEQLDFAPILHPQPLEPPTLPINGNASHRCLSECRTIFDFDSVALV